jgi:hypothetical protein
VCVSCARKEQCWHRDYLDNPHRHQRRLRRHAGAGPSGERAIWRPRFHGQVPPGGGPGGRCERELRGILYRRRFLRPAITEGRSAAYGQYLNAAQIPGGVSRDLRSDCPGRSAGGAAAAALSQRRGRGGPASSVFRDCRGRLRATIESGKCAQAALRSPKYLNEPLRRAGGAALLRHRPGRRLSAAHGGGATGGIRGHRLHEKQGGEPSAATRHLLQDGGRGFCASSYPTAWAAGAGGPGQHRQTVHKLESFLRAGVAPETAMRSAPPPRRCSAAAEHWGYATADLIVH